MREIANKLIIGYQKTLSPDHGPLRHRHPYGYCRYYPSCSEYARQSILNQGVIRGSGLAVARIIRCNPWAKPAIDLPREVAK
jgi:putative membrane protein insertion efficiency factor